MGRKLGSVNFVGNAQKVTYGNAYNHKWQIQPNYSYGNSQPQHLQQPQHNSQVNNIYQTLKKILANQEQMATQIQNQQIAQKKLETQLKQVDQA